MYNIQNEDVQKELLFSNIHQHHYITRWAEAVPITSLKVKTLHETLLTSFIMARIPFFLTLEHAEHVHVNEVDSCTLWNCSQLPGQRKSNQGGRQQFQHSVLGNYQYVRGRFGLFEPQHTQVHCKREPTMGPQTCLTKINK